MHALLVNSQLVVVPLKPVALTAQEVNIVKRVLPLTMTLLSAPQKATSVQQADLLEQHVLLAKLPQTELIAHHAPLTVSVHQVYHRQDALRDTLQQLV
jgi:hypothetical protein